LRRLLPERGERLELPFLEGFVDRAAPRLVVFTLEGGRRGGLQVLDQLAHRLLERGRAARRELDRDRPVGLGEVVDIDPVGRARALGRDRGAEFDRLALDWPIIPSIGSSSAVVAKARRR
jgi:hypothetical protein